MTVTRPQQTSRRGYTLIELVSCLASATVLMVGLASCMAIATRAFDGSEPAVARSQAAIVQADLLNDMRHARTFTKRGATAATFTVPDRDNDGDREVITYNWTGLPTAELTYSYNGGTPTTVLSDVQNFQLGYMNRTMASGVPMQPAIDSNYFGIRWQSGFRFGYQTQFASSAEQKMTSIITRVTLPVNGKIKSISAYLTATGASDIRYAIYQSNASNAPTILKAQSGAFSVNQSGWLTLNVPPTSLTAGEYWLGLSYKTNKVNHHYATTGGNTIVLNNDSSNGWPWWWFGGTSYPYQISIYATCDAE